ncbi:hypothetical protein PR003_g18058 [Phytophthora rubi]|uniref:Uncharacterized protein n=1 Tax=Phytophthora rubi TaxID=129364 RepID=A0A6A4E716_9STRA|nr:hypothetical protein PR003_g18058 [Phytophthora rubi]
MTSIATVSCCSASSSATAVLLHRWRPLLSCCSASSSSTAPMASIAIMPDYNQVARM